MRKHGYSQGYSDSPNRIKNRKDYQEEVQPVIDRLMAERDRAIKLMASKIDKAKYKDLVDATDKMIKNIELLSGRPTNRDDVKIYDENQSKLIADRIINRGK